MSAPQPEEFDPYHEWLGIPVEEQPADYYRLLGLPRFEHNERVIANAYDQKMYFLRNKQLGHFVQLSQKLQNEITTAQRVLLNSEQRSCYDAVLIEAMQLPVAAAPEQVATSPAIFVASPLRKRKSASKKTTMPVWSLWLFCGFLAFVGATGLLVASGGIPALLFRGKTKTVHATPAKARAALPSKRTSGPAIRHEAVKVLPKPEPSKKEIALPVVPAMPKSSFALRFDGIDDRVDLPTFYYKGEFPLTLETWVCLTRGVDEKILECLICDFEGGGIGLANQLGFNPPYPYKWGLSAFNNGYQNAAEREPLPRDALIHLAGVFEPMKHVRFYVNGKLQSSTPVTNAYKASAFPLVIGANPHPRGGGFESYFAGEISAIRISSLARHVDEFTPERHFSVDANTLALYRFEQGVGDVLVDSSNHGHHGKIVGATWVESRPIRQ